MFFFPYFCRRTTERANLNLENVVAAIKAVKLRNEAVRTAARAYDVPRTCLADSKKRGPVPIEDRRKIARKKRSPVAIEDRRKIASKKRSPGKKDAETALFGGRRGLLHHMP